MARRDGSPPFDQVRYQFLAPIGQAVAHAYYLDYPLLFLGKAGSPLSVYEPVGPTVSHTFGAYAVQCLTAKQTTAVVDGRRWEVPCAGPERLTHVFYARTVQAAPGSPPLRVWRPSRFVF